MIDVRGIARALDGDIAGRNTVLCPAPGHSRRDRSLAVRLDPRAPGGFVIYSHAGDDWRDCRDHVRQRLGMPPWRPGEDDRQRSIPSQHVRRWDLTTSEAEWSEPPTADDVSRIQRACALWEEAQEPRRTLAETYLGSRALVLTDDLAGNVLRFHPRCPWRNENTGSIDRVPALIAAFRSIDTDDITAVHRIALTPDGRKIGRRMLGIVRRAAVKLAPVADVVAIGEGIETCMAAQQLGIHPAWALGSVGAIAGFPVLANAAAVTPLGEIGEASTSAMERCGNRWRAAKRRVLVRMPASGSDLNDELMDLSRG